MKIVAQVYATMEDAKRAYYYYVESIVSLRNKYNADLPIVEDRRNLMVQLYETKLYFLSKDYFCNGFAGRFHSVTLCYDYDEQMLVNKFIAERLFE